MMVHRKRTCEPTRLTKRAVDAAKPREREYVLWDTDIKGFGLKVLPSGKKSYLLKYRTKSGMPHKPHIGVHGNITADTAREIAKDWHADVAKGGNPSEERRQARRTGLSQGSRFHDVVKDFIEKYAKVRQRTWKETERTLTTNCADWLERPISSITKTDTYELLDGFIADGHEAKARVTLAWLRTLFRWAVKRDILDTSIMEGIEIEIERKVRRRFYTDREIKAVWKAAENLDATEGGFVKLCLLLGVRKSELAGMRHSEFDDQGDPTLWTIPHERTKTRKTRKEEQVYLVPLPKLAQRILKRLPRRHDDLVFPGRLAGRPMVPGDAIKNRVHQYSGVKDWTYHACRDTVTTWLQTEGHSEFERGLVLNHAGAGTVTADYSHGYPVKLKRELLEKWAQHVENVVQPEGAVLLS